MAMKKAPIVLALIGLLFAVVFVYRMVSPEIVLLNESLYTIDEAVIHLPSNRVVFGEVAPGSENTIYYSLSQADGTYNYSLRLSNGSGQSGGCGYVTNSQIGKRLQIVVNAQEKVVCLESSKIF